MRITYSPEISDLLTNMAKRKLLKMARPLAIYSTAANTAEAEELVKIICNKYPGAPNLVRGVAKTSNTSFFFDKPAAVVVRELTDLKLPKKGKTAPKIIVKMIYTRLVKLRDGIERMKVILAEEATDTDRHYHRNWTVPEITRESLTAHLGFRWSSSDVMWAVIEAGRELGSLFERQDITEQHKDEAWQLYQTYLIMNS